MDKSALDRMHADAAELRSAISELLMHAKTEIYFAKSTGPFNMPEQQRVRWSPLTLDGRRSQSRASRLLGAFEHNLCYLLRRPPDDPSVKFRCLTLRSAIELSTCPPGVDIYRDAFGHAPHELAELLKLIDGAEDTGVRSIIVPDTSYLLNYPNFNDWVFAEREPVVVVLVPEVLRELDRHHKSGTPANRARVRKIRKQLKKHRQSDSLLAGVEVVEGRITVRVSAEEPTPQEFPPGLRSESADDTIIASATELMRTHVRARVAIATDDLLMTFKAEAHHVSVVNPVVEESDKEQTESQSGGEPGRSPFEERVDAELQKAYRKHGRDPWGRHEFYAVLKEEVDELWEAIRSDAPTEDVLAEAAQIACVCRRYAETEDRYRGPHPEVPA